MAGKPLEMEVLEQTSTRNGTFSKAMLDYQRVRWGVHCLGTFTQCLDIPKSFFGVHH